MTNNWKGTQSRTNEGCERHLSKLQGVQFQPTSYRRQYQPNSVKCHRYGSSMSRISIAFPVRSQPSWRNGRILVRIYISIERDRYRYRYQFFVIAIVLAFVLFGNIGTIVSNSIYCSSASLFSGVTFLISDGYILLGSIERENLYPRNTGVLRSVLPHQFFLR